MAILSFSLAPEGTSKLHDLLVCLAKFGDYVAIEAARESVRLDVA